MLADEQRQALQTLSTLRLVWEASQYHGCNAFDHADLQQHGAALHTKPQGKRENQYTAL